MRGSRQAFATGAIHGLRPSDRRAFAPDVERFCALPGWIGVLLRIVLGVGALLLAWATFDRIHDRQTEIAVSCIGLTYCLLGAMSRRWQYFGFSLLVLAGAAAARFRDEPYDMALREETGLGMKRGIVIVTQGVLAAMAALCVFRLVTSLAGHGWDAAWTSLRPWLTLPKLESWLGRL